MKNIFGIYLNNLRFDQIQRIYHRAFPKGKAVGKVDRINEMVEKLDNLPDDNVINDFLFAGRSSILWIPLVPPEKYSLDNVVERLRGSSPSSFENPIEPELKDSFRIVHSFRNNSKLFMTLGIGGYKDHLLVENYRLGKQYSEYFAFAIVRNSIPTLEIRANSALVPRIILALNDELGLGVERSAVTQKITLDEFLTFKKLIPTAQLRKYKGRSIDDNSITEIFEYTARPDIDYADEQEFLDLIMDKEDESVSFSFEFDGYVYTAKLGLHTRSIFFQSYVSEQAIDYIYQVYRDSIMQ